MKIIFIIMSIILLFIVLNYLFWIISNCGYEKRMYLSWKSICRFYHLNPDKWICNDASNFGSSDFFYKLFYNYKRYSDDEYKYAAITTSLFGFYKLNYYYTRWKKNEKIKKKNSIKKEIIESLQNDINIELQKATKLINNANKQIEEIRKGIK